MWLATQTGLQKGKAADRQRFIRTIFAERLRHEYG
jgi:hypothetical protein